MAKKEKIEEEKIESGSNSLLGSILNESKDQHFNAIEPENILISSGSLTLDSITRIRTGSVIRLCALSPEAGKTSQSLLFAKNFMETCQKGKTLFIKAEGRLGPDLKERSGLVFVTKPEEWNYGTVFIWSINIFETIADAVTRILKEMHEKGEKLCVIIDSLDGVILKSDSEKDLWGSKDSPKIAGIPLLTKLFFKTMSLPIAHYDAFVIITSQYAANISIDPYAVNVPRQAQASGGSSIGHQADYVFEYGPKYGGDLILENDKLKPDLNTNKIIGHHATITIKKSSTDVSGTKVKIPIKKGRIGGSVWIEKEIVDMILSYQLAKTAGAWISFDDRIIAEAAKDGIELKKQIQGINKLYEYLESDKKILDWFLNKIKKTIINV